MTDCSPTIVSWWKQISCLQSYLEEGLLEVYSFDITKVETEEVQQNMFDPYFIAFIS